MREVERHAGRAGPSPGRRARPAGPSRTCRAPGRARAAARSSARPSASLPRSAAITTANERPRANAGHVGDRREVHDRRPRHELLGQRRAAARSTRAAPRRRARTGRTARRRRARRPAWTSNSIAVTTPKLPPPPRSAQNRSGSLSASVRTRLAVGGDELERGHGVGLQPVLAREPAHAAAERVAGDADVGRGAVQAREAVGRQARRDALPLDARADADAPGAGVDADLLERGDVQQQRVVQAAERALVVRGRLRARRAARRARA